LGRQFFFVLRARAGMPKRSQPCAKPFANLPRATAVTDSRWLIAAAATVLDCLGVVDSRADRVVRSAAAGLHATPQETPSGVMLLLYNAAKKEHHA